MLTTNPRVLAVGMHIKRWIALLIVGIGMISLGVGYFLVSVYRNVPLPEVFYWFTLQFLPREIRGILFVGLGIYFTILAINRIYRNLLIPYIDETGILPMDAVYQKNVLSRGAKIVCIGGGPGLSILMSSLSNSTSNLWGITLNQGPARTKSERGLLGNRVLMASDDELHWTAYLASGGQVNGESEIRARREGKPIDRIEITRPDGLLPDANQKALDAIAKADAIIFGPGDLFGQIVPPVLVPDIAQALQRSQARKIFVCNIMTQAGRTNSFSVADHVRVIERAGNFQIDYVLVNNRQPGEKIERAYHDALQSQVVFTPEKSNVSQVTFRQSADKFVLVEGAFLVEADLLTDMREEVYAAHEFHSRNKSLQVIRHDPAKLGAAVMQLVQSESWRLKDR